MIVPRKVEELNEGFLKELLQKEKGIFDVGNVSYAVEVNDTAVLSTVVSIDVVFEVEREEDEDKLHEWATVVEGETVESEKKKWTWSLIAKFVIPDLPFQSMFVVEGFFYNQVVEKYGSKLPFSVPHVLVTSDHMILMEKLKDVIHCSPSVGCPTEYILPVVHCLAQFHARFWTYDCLNLASPAGIGASLSGPEKNALFPSLWRSFLADIDLDDDTSASLTGICEQLASSDLSVIHDLVHSEPCTLIHGDFHVANILFKNTNGKVGDIEMKDVCVLDWATCGSGSPLRDLAFFNTVSVDSENRRSLEVSCLKVYHDTLVSEGIHTMSYDDCVHSYKTNIINQFVILVVYDKLSKSFAEKARTIELREHLHNHFKIVNKRSCLAVLDNMTNYSLTPN